MPERALLALQGPYAVAALSRLNAGVAALTFMSGGVFAFLWKKLFRFLPFVLFARGTEYGGEG